MDDGMSALAGIGSFLVFVVIYVYVALCLQAIARKTNTENAWMAWVPILNVVLMLNVAGRPLWWIVLLLIPIVNVIIGIIVAIGIAQARNKPGWLGVLFLIPLVNFIVLGYLAFSE